ncbi:DedA family protein [Croceicoccus naphthovorans]|uniref:Alkaline phosphatase n=1 Tax=Croceicoccus naphthovorans TaxID=1348774 RepID=A0A0G3XEK7_9SPHN|nr:DedA family protein [Croceicoccus naphthovorans]AKM10005.1 alkaline phosphatase [Croceicoccus naphthovorans]MBB3991117.1 membrane protein DedA with SNARE-associated domain [Croceicoccus naphthovorans]
MNDFIIQLIEGGGYLGIAFLMALENVFPPIPSEVIMGVAGVAVHAGRMDFWQVLWWGTLGATVGNYAWFYLGKRLGYERLRPFVEKHGRWLTMDWSHVEASSQFFRKHGQWVVFFLRFSPLMRTIISLPAGLAHMGTGRFLIFTFLGSAVWNAALIGSATLLASWFTGFEEVLGYIVIGMIAVGAVWYAWRVMTWRPSTPAEDPAE